MSRNTAFSEFQYGLTAGLLTVVSHRIARDFNKPWATQAVSL